MSYEEVKKETKKAFKKFRKNGFIPPIDMTDRQLVRLYQRYRSLLAVIAPLKKDNKGMIKRAKVMKKRLRIAMTLRGIPENARPEDYPLK